MTSKEHGKLPLSVHLIAGGIGGTVSATLTCPLEVIKTQMQAANVLSESQRRPFASIGILTGIYRREGLRGLYRGFVPLVMGVGPTRAIHFATYNAAKRKLTPQFGDSVITHAGSAACAGFASYTLGNPVWVVKTRLQIQQPLPPEFTQGAKKCSTISSTSAPARHFFSKSASLDTRSLMSRLFSSSSAASSSSTASAASAGVPQAATVYRGTLHAFQTIYREEGMRGFFRGVTASYLGIAEGMIQFALYEQIKLYFLDETRKSDHQLVFGSQVLLASAVTKIIATTLTYPHEVVRTRLREQRIPASASPAQGFSVLQSWNSSLSQKTAPQPRIHYEGLINTFRVIIREEGVRALYFGLGPHVLRVVPSSAILFLTYEAVTRCYHYYAHELGSSAETTDL